MTAKEKTRDFMETEKEIISISQFPRHEMNIFWHHHIAY